MKRKLGLGKASKVKKQKASDNEDKSKDASENSEQVLTVELKSAKDGEMGELEGLWETWFDGEQDNELILNGVINECDRMERNSENLSDEFKAIYAMALSEMAKFQADEVEDWIEFAWSKVASLDSDVVNFAKCIIGLNEIGVLVGKLDLDSKECSKDISALFSGVIDNWNKAKSNKDLLQYKWVLSILDTLDDLLDMIDKFGSQKAEVVDSDNEDAVEFLNNFDDHEVELKKTHPLYKIQHTDDFNNFWRSATLEIKDDVKSEELKKPIFKKLGQSYLMEAEHPIAVYTSLTYETDNATKDEKLQANEARKDAKELVSKALDLLEKTWDDEDPQSWVDIAEAEIVMGNLFDVDTKEQEKWYQQAEKKLKLANNSSHGKYQQILDSLLEKDEN